MIIDKTNSMQCHVFDGDVFFLTEQIIRSYVKFSQEEYEFLVRVSTRDLAQRYQALFRELAYSHYKIVDGSSFIKLPWLLRFLAFFKRNSIPSYDQEMIELLNARRERKIILHGNLFSPIFTYFLLLTSWKDLNWICWGNFLNEYVAKSFKHRIHAFCMCRLYRRFRRVICLMAPDMDKARKIYGVKHVFLCPYPGTYDSETFLSCPPSQGNRILIGNSKHTVFSYIEFTRKLIPYHAKLDLTFMIPYGGSTLDAPVEELRKMLDENGFHYEFWRDILPLEAYRKKMQEFAVYVCPFPTQSGLGAISTMIASRRSVYITGYNLAWYKFLGIHVHTLDEFITRLSQGESLHDPEDVYEANREKLLHIFDGHHRLAMLNLLLHNDNLRDIADSAYL